MKAKLQKSLQIQLDKDKKIFKETGCMTELLMRVEYFNRNQND